MSKYKILLVASKFLPEYSGPGVRIFRTYQRLSNLGSSFKLSAICNSTEFSRNKNYTYKGIKIRRISSTLFHNWNNCGWSILKRILYAFKFYTEAFFTLIYLIKQKPDIIHAWGGSASVAIAIIWSRYKKTPLIVELVTDKASPFPYLPFTKQAIRPNIKQNTLIVAISDDLKNLCKLNGITSNVWARPNPVDESRFNLSLSEKDELRSELTPFSKQDCILLSVAKFIPQKNQIFLLDVLLKLPESYKLVLAGPIVASGSLLQRDNDYFKHLKEMALKPELAGRVHFVADFVDAAKYMKLSDINLLPSVQEGLGTPLLEGFATGLPAVANNDIPAFRQWVNNGLNGYACRLEVDKWVDAIIKLKVFSNNQRQQLSNDILNISSSSIIDQQFNQLLEALVELPYGTELNVSDILQNHRKLMN